MMPAPTADNPIERLDEDRLGRGEAARIFAEDTLAQDPSRGLVVGVLGPWGAGKTSFINLAREHLVDAGASVLDFNPWMFSGADQLVEKFFIELSAELKLEPGLQRVGEQLSEYGEALAGLTWLPFIGVWLERGRLTAKLLTSLLKRRAEGSGAKRKRLEETLKKLSSPIIVVLDDIDRLTTSEIRDVFKLIRLTASFPNVVYLVAFDRARVESALTEDGIPGRAYVEKILQLAFDLPATPEHVLRREVLEALQSTLDGVEHPGEIDQNAWPDIFMELIDPLIRNMRDVRRYVAAARGTVTALRGEIALADVLALEAVRVFLPDTFALLPGSVEALTTPTSGWSGAASPRLKAEIEALLAASGDHRGLVEAMITRLFPAAQQYLPHGMHYSADWARTWLRHHRIAHADYLRLYLERIAGSGLVAFRSAERAWDLFDDAARLDDYLRSLDDEGLEDVVAALETYEAEFKPEHVVPGSVVLLNLLPDIPDRERGMLEMDTRLVVGRVVYRLVRLLQDPGAVRRATDEILPQVRTLSSRFELVTDVGYREGAGHRLVSEDDARDLEHMWRDQVRAASPAELAREWDLMRILVFTNRESDDDEDPLAVPDDPAVTAALLRSAYSVVRGQSVGNRAVHLSPRLWWDGLVELYGSEDVLTARVASLKDSDIDVDPDLFELADRYASGWRPRDFGRDENDDE